MSSDILIAFVEWAAALQLQIQKYKTITPFTGRVETRTRWSGSLPDQQRGRSFSVWWILVSSLILHVDSWIINRHRCQFWHSFFGSFCSSMRCSCRPSKVVYTCTCPLKLTQGLTSSLSLRWETRLCSSLRCFIVHIAPVFVLSKTYCFGSVFEMSVMSVATAKLQWTAFQPMPIVQAFCSFWLQQRIWPFVDWFIQFMFAIAANVQACQCSCSRSHWFIK